MIENTFNCNGEKDIFALSTVGKVDKNMDALQDEVESLEAILMDDVSIRRNPESGLPELIETTIFPVVGDEDELKYICVTLQVKPTLDYPDVSPSFNLLRPRGLDDARLEAIRAACTAKLLESVGYPVVFDLIEVVREHLTGSNVPSGQCVICLYGFADGDEFTRTECFHFLHSYCLARHMNAMRRNYQQEFEKLPAWQQKIADPFQATCPVCRERIKQEDESLKCAMPPSELENAPDFELTEELRELQQRMSALFLQQKSRGAIIEIDAEVGPVIAIETEQEMRRRLQRQQEEAAKPVVESSAIVGYHDAEKPETACAVPNVAQTAAAATAQSTQRDSEPTNNNYQHHRRGYRGGRRHQQHNHHHNHRHRNRDRDGDHEHQSAGASTSAAAAVPPNTGNKQGKGQMANSAHSR